MRRTAAFLVDNRPEAGLGHLSRCSAIAAHLERLGWSCLMLDEQDEVRTEFDIIVVDDYRHDASFESTLRRYTKLLVAFDDVGDRSHAADVVIDSSDSNRAAAHSKNVIPGARILAGPSYAPLNNKFFPARQHGLPRAGKRVSRVLVAYGSGEVTSVVRITIEMMGAFKDIEIELVAQGANLELLDSVLKKSPNRVHVHRNVQDMALLMARCDVAFGAAGITAWERCALGLPSIVVRTVDNQRYVAEALARKHAAIIIGDRSQATPEKLGEAFTQLATDRETRRKMSTAAACLCDGLGAARIAAYLDVMPSAKDGRHLTLRAASIDDLDIVFEWQLEDRTRAHAHNPQKPSRSGHAVWFREKIESAGCVLQIIEHGGTPAGVLRLDKLESQHSDSLRISIYTAPDKHSLGLGTAALSLVRRMLPNSTLIAEVLPGNVVSHALFRKMGYVWDGRKYQSNSVAGHANGS